MQRDADNLIDPAWLAQCAHRLRERWPHVLLVDLEEAAREIWGDERLRSVPGEEAAERWLRPLVS